MTQKTIIISKLLKDGFIDNFWSIENKISLRLGARIFDLEKDGWIFKTEKHGKNYFYYLQGKPTSQEAPRASQKPSQDIMYSQKQYCCGNMLKGLKDHSCDCIVADAEKQLAFLTNDELKMLW